MKKLITLMLCLLLVICSVFIVSCSNDDGGKDKSDIGTDTNTSTNTNTNTNTNTGSTNTNTGSGTQNTGVTYTVYFENQKYRLYLLNTSFDVPNTVGIMYNEKTTYVTLYQLELKIIDL